MTITTPIPQGMPDYYDGIVPVGVVLLNQNLTTTTSAAWPTIPVNQCSAIAIYGNVNLGTDWSITAAWSTDSAGADVVMGPDEWYGHTAPGVFDTLPVIAPYITFTLNSVFGANVGCTLQVTTTLATARSSSQRFGGGLCIDEAGLSCGVGTTEIYGGFIAPGTYQYFIQPTAALTGQAILANTFNGGIAGRVRRVVNPTANQEIQGQAVFGTAQAVISIVNTGAGAVPVNMSLWGPA